VITAIQMVNNFGQNINPIIAMIYGLSFVAGSIIEIECAMRIHRFGKGDPQTKPGSIASSFLIGGALIAMPLVTGMGIASLFSSATPNALVYSGPGAGGMSTAMVVIMHFIQLIGVGAMVKGMFVWHRIGRGTPRQGDTMSKAGWHLVGGALAANIAGTALMLGNSVGIHLPF
jgi:hypothetical protein